MHLPCSSADVRSMRRCGSRTAYVLPCYPQARLEGGRAAPTASRTSTSTWQPTQPAGRCHTTLCHRKRQGRMLIYAPLVHSRAYMPTHSGVMMKSFSLYHCFVFICFSGVSTPALTKCIWWCLHAPSVRMVLPMQVVKLDHHDCRASSVCIAVGC